MAVFYHNVTKVDNHKNVYMAGSTLNNYNNNDIIVQKFSQDGFLYWEKTFNGNANMDDMAADIFIDEAFNVYITGTSIENQGSGYDLVVLKYNSDGVLQWEYYYDNEGNPAPKDAGTAITGDNNGNIYVTGTSFGANTLADYVTLRVDATSGNPVWTKRYDYQQLNDVPAKIELHGNYLYVSGGSQSASNTWELATAFYDIANGNQLGVKRSTGSMVHGVDEVHDLTTDINGNVYVTGAVKNQNYAYDVAVYKLDPQLNLLWERYFDGYGYDDKGKGIKVDSQGNVYVAGYVATANRGNNYLLIKYNAQGNLQWEREFDGRIGGDDEAIQLAIANTNTIYVTGFVHTTSTADIQTLAYHSDGKLFAQASFNGAADINDKPNGIAIDLEGNIIVVGQMEATNGKYKNITIKYKPYFKPFDPKIINGKPAYNSHEIIIRFDRSVIKYPAINNTKFLAGQLNDFVKPIVVNRISNKLGIEADRLTTFKIFGNMTIADTLAINHSGDTIKVTDLWAMLSVMFPKNINIDSIIDSLNTMQNMIHYAEFNHIGKFLGVPNDPYYSTSQSGLYNSTYGINVEGAWDKQVGSDDVSVGIIGTGINWRHEDFGDGTLAGSVIAGGKDYTVDPYGIYLNSSDPTPDPSGHGTAVAGIIGAIRNNGKGVAGVAGGDIDSLGIHGVKLLSFTCPYVSYTSMAPALKDAAFSFHVDIINCSWVIPFYYKKNWELFSNIYKKGCIVVAACNSGDSSNFINTPHYPASFPDKWIIKVGGNDSTGTRWKYSMYDYNTDVLAPSVTGTWQSVGLGNSSYVTGNGTSFAAPQVAGVAALMLSQHSKETNILYPNSLCQEDIDEILKRTATPVTIDVAGGSNLPIPNIYSGYGRVNAGEALNAVSLPYRIHHFEITADIYNQTGFSVDTTLVATDQVVTYPIGIPGYPQTTVYNADTVDIYKYTVTIPQSYNTAILPYLPPSETVIDGWVRNSSCDLFGLNDTIMNDFVGGVTLDYLDENTAILTGYIYKAKLYDNNGNYLTDIWYPKHLGEEIKFAYSVYTIDDNPNVGIKKENNVRYQVSLYPNPATNQLNFSIATNTPKLAVEIFDISGRKVSTTKYNSPNQGMYSKSIDVSALKKGLYLCRFIFDNHQVTRKFIKR